MLKKDLQENLSQGSRLQTWTSLSISHELLNAFADHARGLKEGKIRNSDTTQDRLNQSKSPIFGEKTLLPRVQ